MKAQFSSSNTSAHLQRPHSFEEVFYLHIATMINLAKIEIILHSVHRSLHKSITFGHTGSFERFPVQFKHTRHIAALPGGSQTAIQSTGDCVKLSVGALWHCGVFISSRIEAMAHLWLKECRGEAGAEDSNCID